MPNYSLIILLMLQTVTLVTVDLMVSADSQYCSKREIITITIMGDLNHIISLIPLTLFSTTISELMKRGGNRYSSRGCNSSSNSNNHTTITAGVTATQGLESITRES